ncbi:MAG: UDP binding domain-containing protein, partial [Ignavibacteria bacterium]
GNKGIFYSNTFAEAGYKVICTDANPTVIKKVSKGRTGSSSSQVEAKLKRHITSGQISVSSERKKAVSQSDVVLITIGARVDDQKKSDYSQIVSACKQVGAGLQKGTLVIYCGVAGIGFTEDTIKETLENTSGLKVGLDFGLAYSPILTAEATVPDMELKVAASDLNSLKASSTLLRTLTKKVKEIDDVKSAEMSALFAAAKRDANRALANELAIFCESANTDYFKVLRCLDINDPTFLPSTTEEENRNESYLLLDCADNLNVKLRLPALARQINEDMVKHAVNLTQNALRSTGKPLRRARIAILGTANPTTAIGIFVKMLEQKGAKPTLYDPNSKIMSQEWSIVKPSLNDAVEGTDCIVILTGQEQFKNFNLKKLKPLMKKTPVIVDLLGTYEPKRVEAEGFKYFGLGKGTDKN